MKACSKIKLSTFRLVDVYYGFWCKLNNYGYFSAWPNFLLRSPHSSKAAISTIFLLANRIKKGQFDTSEITGLGAIILQVWEAVLAA